MRQDKQ